MPTVIRKAAAGGGSGAAQWAVHAACARFRGTDALITGRSRRTLAGEIGAPDTSAAIPEARWTRAMIFERLCHDPAFAGEVAARATGWTGFGRPNSVTPVDCAGSTTRTAELLAEAAARASSGAATLLSRLSVPFPGLDAESVTSVLPDLAVVARGPSGPTLIVGDVKDYERVRSRLDDGRLLKGFLQVAMGALAFMEWPQRPAGLTVSDHGFLAVPRSVFLQPTVEVEDLTDHLLEVRDQVGIRSSLVAETAATPDRAYVQRLEATFDPATCPSCSLHNFCRSELRTCGDVSSLLAELGVAANERSSVAPLLHGEEPLPSARAHTVQLVTASMSGRPSLTGQRRLDPAGVPGSIDVIAVKSDAAALGFHGLGLRRHAIAGPGPWQFVAFDDPQADVTRRRVMALIGAQLEFAMAEGRREIGQDRPIHIVVPDTATADLLASTADLLAGVELSRLRWARDLEMGREPLTYNGEHADVPKALGGERRTAVSFLLEQDRARMLLLRAPVVNLTRVATDHFVPGGPATAARRLDYVLRWAEAEERVDFRVVGDAIEAFPHTPGARLTNTTSDEFTSELQKVRAGAPPRRYRQLVEEELRYKAGVVDGTLAALGAVPYSKLAPAVRSFEGDAQEVWRRRMRLRASDLVRFGRTYPYWRNQLVRVIEADRTAHRLVQLLANPQLALEAATDAGDRQVTAATVVSTAPLTLAVDSRQFTDGTDVLLLAAGSVPWVETDRVQVITQQGSIRLRGFPEGRLDAGVGTIFEPGPGRFLWTPKVQPAIDVGDRLILARRDAFDAKQSGFNIPRPAQDELSAPKRTCDESSYEADSQAHRWCCKPHELVEADFADELAARRARRELNPEVWPPVHDTDGFEVPPTGKPTSRDVHVSMTQPPEGMTTDELE